MRKSRVAIFTDYPSAKTGLGRNGKELALYLHNTGKYEVIYYSCGMNWQHPDFMRWPFKVYGALPCTAEEINRLNQDQGLARSASYGNYLCEKFLTEAKPDVCILSNDSWAFEQWRKPYWDKINWIPHITLDSLPFLPDQVDFIKKSKQFYVWSTFAVKEAKRLGHNNVKLLTGMINDSSFFKLPEHEKLSLRKKFGIEENAFICGFVFRNQLRKELKPLLEGYAMFKRENPKVKSYLLLHTSIVEGWDIPRLCKELNISFSEILITYICKNCREIEVKHIQGHDLNCKFCGAEKAQISCNVGLGCTEEQLNQVYNLMDCYCHPMNAGGLEIPIVEALYSELPIATVDYSSGEMFTQCPFVTALDFAWTVQIGTQFKRSAPYPSAIAKYLKKIHGTNKGERHRIGASGRKWALETFTPQIVGKQWEEAIDALPLIEGEIDLSIKLKNPDYPMPDIADNEAFIDNLYVNMLDMHLPAEDGGKGHWLGQLKNGMKREQIYLYFKKVATEENAKHAKPVTLDKFLGPEKAEDRIIFNIPESLGDCMMFTALLEDAREIYKDKKIYVATKPQFFDVFLPLIGDLIDYVIEWRPEFDNTLMLEGAGVHKGYFKIAFQTHFANQRMLNYVRNAADQISFNLRKS